MSENVAAIRFAPYGPLVFCYAAERDLARGTRVRVELAGEVCEGVVAIAPEQIISAPRVTAVIAPREQAPASNDRPGITNRDAGNRGRLEAGDPRGERRSDDALSVPDGVVFLPADDGAIGPADLAVALRLAALPIPEPPAERR